MHHADRTLEQNDFASQPCRDAPVDAPVDQAATIPVIGASPLPHPELCPAARQEEYGGNEYGGLPIAVNYAVPHTISCCDNALLLCARVACIGCAS